MGQTLHKWLKSFDLKTIAQYLLLLFPVGFAAGRAPADIIASVIVLLYIFHLIVTKEVSIFKTRWVQCGLIFWSWMMLSALWAADFSMAFTSGLVWGRYLFFAIALGYWLLTDSKIQQRFFIVCSVVATLLAVDAIYQYVTGADIIGRPIQSKGTRLTGPYTTQRIGAAIMYFILPLISVALLQPLPTGKKLSVMGASLICIIGIVLSGERAVLLLTLFALTLLGLSFIIRSNKKILLKALPFAVIIFILLCGSLYFFSQKTTVNHQERAYSLVERQFDSIVNTIQNIGQSSYGKIWKDSFLLVKEHPILGVGARNTRVYWCERNGHHFYEGEKKGGCATHAHNPYIEILTELGVIGLVLYLSLLIALVATFWHHRNIWLESPLILGIVVTIFVRAWPIIATTSHLKSDFSLPLWMMVGWGIASIMTLKNSKSNKLS